MAERAPIEVVAAVVWRDGRVLLTQRPPGGPLGGLWEFPGGKIEPGETPEQALVREIEEEIGVRATPLGVVARHRHRYAHGLDVGIVFVRCELSATEFRPSAAVHASRWARPEDVDLEELLEGDRPFLRSLVTERKDAD
jgi:mutator protein MutT